MVQEAASTSAPTAFDDWASGVLRGIGAPVTQQNLDFLAAWARFESGPDVMRWNNPLNTTQGPGIDMNSVGVKQYPDVQTGITRTVETLQNGLYPQILSGLQSSQPTSWYAQNAATDLGKWGSGTSWIGNADKLAADVNKTGGSSNGSSGGINITDPVTAGFKSITDAVGNVLHRVAFFIIGGMLILLGLYLLFSPQAKEAAQESGKLATLAAA